VLPNETKDPHLSEVPDFGAKRTSTLAIEFSRYIFHLLSKRFIYQHYPQLYSTSQVRSIQAGLRQQKPLSSLPLFSSSLATPHLSTPSNKVKFQYRAKGTVKYSQETDRQTKRRRYAEVKGFPRRAN